MMLFSPANSFANGVTNEDNKDDWRIGFIQERMASLINDMENELDQTTMASLLETMGRQCAKWNTEKCNRYKGDLNGYLKEIEGSLEKIEHDKDNGIIKIIGKKNKSCFCPFVDKSKMTKEFCNCTKGWQKETYEAIIGKPIEVKIDTSVLSGDEGCGFTITYPV